MHTHICSTCGAEFPPAQDTPHRCPICEDPRQYVPEEGQQWTNELELAQTRRTEMREAEPGLIGISVEPKVGIGQRAFLIEHPEGGVMWDGVPFLDEAAVIDIKNRGGVRAMVMSHPHLYGAMVTNSIKLGNVPIYIPEADRDWVMYPHENIRFFSEDKLDLGDGISLNVTGGHFEGSSFLHWPGTADGKGAILTGDTIIGVSDRDWVSFIWSAPNRVNLGPKAIKRIVESANRYEYDRLYDAWWGSGVKADAKAKVSASAERIIAIQNAA